MQWKHAYNQLQASEFSIARNNVFSKKTKPPTPPKI